jgi:hypothetical protein
MAIFGLIIAYSGAKLDPACAREYHASVIQTPRNLTIVHIIGSQAVQSICSEAFDPALDSPMPAFVKLFGGLNNSVTEL